MMYKKNSFEIFYLLLKAGLWETDARLALYAEVEYKDVIRIARQQSVAGLVAVGLEHVVDVDVPIEETIPFVGDTLQIEQKNNRMNVFISQLICDLREVDIYALIVKGQGVAQCYERPLLRAPGDIDLYLDESDFQKAKRYFRPLVSKFDPDNDYAKHINMNYGEWIVEIHANQNCSLSQRINQVMGEIHWDLFYNGNVRGWQNNGMQVFMPSVDDHAIIIFTHFFNHYYKGGVGVRQICDWCRLLWTYRDTLNNKLLESRIRRAGLLDEWKAFGAYAVSYLGMPEEAMPLYDSSPKWQKKADRISDFLLEVGNFGQNRNTSYYKKYPFLIRKSISFGRRLKDVMRHARLFPMDTLRFTFGMTINGFKAVSHGE